LAALRKDVKLNKNLMPSIIKCVEAFATLGEISQVMREEFGEYRENQ
jgi:methylmalonyl-CoA mutase N-terminal domain/subunit